jgi:hypothetical protein
LRRLAEVGLDFEQAVVLGDALPTAMLTDELLGEADRKLSDPCGGLGLR